jgi:hypothetical protein
VMVIASTRTLPAAPATTANLFVEQSACTRTAPTAHSRRSGPASRVRCARAGPVGWPWGIAPPGLPQIRACAIGAPGSSCHGLTARRTAPSRTRRHSLRQLRYPLEFRGDGAGARRLRHRSPQRFRDPVLLSLGGVPRVGSPASSVRCSTPTSPRSSRVTSSSFDRRYRSCGPLFRRHPRRSAPRGGIGADHRLPHPGTSSGITEISQVPGEPH